MDIGNLSFGIFLQASVICARSLFRNFSMIYKSSVGFFGLLLIRLNSHFAWGLLPYYSRILIVVCELSCQVLTRTLSQVNLPFQTFEF